MPQTEETTRHRRLKPIELDGRTHIHHDDEHVRNPSMRLDRPDIPADLKESGRQKGEKAKLGKHPLWQLRHTEHDHD